MPTGTAAPGSRRTAGLAGQAATGAPATAPDLQGADANEADGETARSLPDAAARALGDTTARTASPPAARADVAAAAEAGPVVSAGATPEAVRAASASADRTAASAATPAAVKAAAGTSINNSARTASEPAALAATDIGPSSGEDVSMPPSSLRTGSSPQAVVARLPLVASGGARGSSSSPSRNSCRDPEDSESASRERNDNPGDAVLDDALSMFYRDRFDSRGATTSYGVGGSDGGNQPVGTTAINSSAETEASEVIRRAAAAGLTPANAAHGGDVSPPGARWGWLWHPEWGRRSRTLLAGHHTIHATRRCPLRVVVVGCLLQVLKAMGPLTVLSAVGQHILKSTTEPPGLVEWASVAIQLSHKGAVPLLICAAVRHLRL